MCMCVCERDDDCVIGVSVSRCVLLFLVYEYKEKITFLYLYCFATAWITKESFISLNHNNVLIADIQSIFKLEGERRYVLAKNTQSEERH